MSSQVRTDVGATHVALTVADLDASIAFYARYAAMKVVHEPDASQWDNAKSPQPTARRVSMMPGTVTSQVPWEPHA